MDELHNLMRILVLRSKKAQVFEAVGEATIVVRFRAQCKVGVQHGPRHVRELAGVVSNNPQEDTPKTTSTCSPDCLLRQQRVRNPLLEGPASSNNASQLSSCILQGTAWFQVMRCHSHTTTLTTNHNHSHSITAQRGLLRAARDTSHR
jgi:hypothetical protein